jgi:hypothetical protein
MRRFFTRLLILVALFFLSLPVGLSIIGCTSNVGAYCNGSGYGQKVGTLNSITLQPEITGVSLAYGQTRNTPFSATAIDCKQSSVSVSSYKYGTTDMNIADVDPSGNLCAGTWNRNSPGGIANYTICTPPSAPGVAYVTASANGVTSNTVPVFIHPPIQSITIPTQQACVSQGNTLAAPFSQGTVVIDTNGNQIPDGFFNGQPTYPNGQPVPNYVGTISYVAQTPSIVSINNTVLPNAQGVNENGQATAQSPGSTVITASIPGTSSTAGYFYTCPPASISLQYAQGGTSATVNVGIPKNLVATVTDVNGVQLTGLTLTYTSTNPTNIAASSPGTVSATYPGSAAVTAICEPLTCNPAPINILGQLGTGMPVVSNSVQATTKGRLSNYVWVSSPKTQNFVQLDLSNGGVGALVKMPYFPNSMVLSQDGSTLYFGGNNPPDASGNPGVYRELMTYNATSNTLKKEDTSVPGVVLAVSPDSSLVVINDQVRQVLYLYSPSGGSNTSIGGIGTKAAFTPDSQTLYIVGTKTDASGINQPTLFVHNAYTGWTTYTLSAPATDVTVTVPSVAAYLAGNPTTANGFCPKITANGTNSTIVQSYPPADSVQVATDRLTATHDGLHILGASASTGLLTDIAPTVPTGTCPYTIAANGITTAPGLSINHSVQQVSLGITASAINQVVVSPNSSIAFVTYNTQSTSSGALLPYYKPNGTPATAANLGVEGSVTLSGGATDPLVGIFSPDNTIFFVGTAGDNLLHFIDPVGLTDTQTVDPKLVDSNGSPVPPEFLAAFPRPTT